MFSTNYRIELLYYMHLMGNRIIWYTTVRHNEHTHFCRNFVAKSAIWFSENEGGGQRPFGTFPKFHPFWCPHLSLRHDKIGLSRSYWARCLWLLAHDTARQCDDDYDNDYGDDDIDDADDDDDDCLPYLSSDHFFQNWLLHYQLVAYLYMPRRSQTFLFYFDIFTKRVKQSLPTMRHASLQFH